MTASTIVIVDPYSSGTLLVSALQEEGYSVVAVTSGECIPAMYESSFRASDFDAWFTCPDITPALIEELRSRRPIAILPGAEIGVEVADRLSAQITPHLANLSQLASARSAQGRHGQGIASQGNRYHQDTEHCGPG
ncbi:hypothetical protein ACQ4WX_38640 [Streptomyces lasalocidi]